MPQEQPKKITVTFPDNSTTTKVVDLIVRKRPIGWSRRSYATYYKEVYALWLKKDIDEMILDRQPRVYRYDMFTKVSRSSLYLRVNQATAYLLDYLDPDGKYKKFFSETRTKREDYGISIKFDEVVEGEQRAEKYIGESDKPKWKIKMDNYLESDDIEEPFHQTGLLLSDNEMEQIKLELSGLSNIMFSVTSREIKIIKGV